MDGHVGWESVHVAGWVGSGGKGKGEGEGRRDRGGHVIGRKGESQKRKVRRGGIRSRLWPRGKRGLKRRDEVRRRKNGGKVKKR